MKNKKSSNGGSMMRQLFNFHDERAKGRVCMLVLTVYTNIFTCINSGIFYTGFLSANDINIVNVGIINFLPFFAGMFSVFSPYILGHFKKRRAVLTVSRILYYFFSLFASTIMPNFVHDASLKILLFCIFVFVANLINALFVSPGYSAWHLNFIPEDVRVNYFSVSQIIGSVVSSIFFLVSTLLTDRIGDVAQQGPMFATIRYITFACAIGETLFLMLPKEYPYVKIVKVNLASVFSLSFKNRGFMGTMLIVFFWNFFQYAALTPTDYYLINNIGVKYTFIAIITLLYSVFLLALSPMWRKIINRHGWISVFGLTAAVQGCTNILYAFITPENYIPVMLIVRLTQHFIGVGLNLTYANVMYLRMPSEDRTSYISFYLFFASVAMFLGLLCGTTFVGLAENIAVNILGFTFYNVPLLMLFQAAGQITLGLISYACRKRLEPRQAE